MPRPMSLCRACSDTIRAAALTLALSALPAGLAANTAQAVLPGADIRGAATFRYLGVALYDASLFTQGGGALNWTRDFGLELRYKRTLSQKSLVDATLREMERLVHPSSVSASGSRRRRIRRKGALIAWVFFMLFALSLTAVTLMLTGLGIGFQDGLVLAIAALSTTGPLAQSAVDVPVEILSEGFAVKYVLCAAMVLGRLETLAIIALLSPNLWRN